MRLAVLLAPLVLAGCRPADPGAALHDGGARSRRAVEATASAPTVPAGEADDPPEARAARAALVRSLLVEIDDARVRDAMERVPRHLFMPGASVHRAYADHPAPIGYGQTISQPTVVAMMTQALRLEGRERVLEIGTGSGYQAAILSTLSAEVYSIEIVEPLAIEARARLARLGYSNVRVRAGDGYQGWPEHAPFDRILLTAAPDELPRALLEQLTDGGLLVAPVGPERGVQRLVRVKKTGARFEKDDLGAVHFVPMVPGD